MVEYESIVYPLLILLSAVSFIVAVIVYFRSEKEPEALQRRFLPRFYAYAVLFFSSVVLVVGGGLLLKAALSYPLGLEFSYRGQPVYAEVVYEESRPYLEPPEFERVEYRQEWRLTDLLNGATLVATGSLFLASHWVLRNRLEGKEERPVSFLNRAYLMVSGVVYGGLSLVLIPTALRQLIEFYLLPRGDPETTLWTWPIPGASLGYALAAVAFWLWAVAILLRNLRFEGPEA